MTTSPKRLKARIGHLATRATMRLRLRVIALVVVSAAAVAIPEISAIETNSPAPQHRSVEVSNSGGRITLDEIGQ